MLALFRQVDGEAAEDLLDRATDFWSNTASPDEYLKRNDSDKSREFIEKLRSVSGIIREQDEYPDVFAYYEFSLPSVALKRDVDRPDYILIDEVQDLTNAQIKSSAKLAKSGCILAGDMNQSVKNKSESWRELGLDIHSSRSKTLSVNYRSSAKIQQLGKEYTKYFQRKPQETRYESLLPGPPAELFLIPDAQNGYDETYRQMVASVKMCRNELGVPLENICIAAFSREDLRKIQVKLSELNFNSQFIDDTEYSFGESDGVIRLCTAQSIKGIDCAVLLFMVSDLSNPKKDYGIREKNLGNTIYTVITRSMYLLQIFIPESCKTSSINVAGLVHIMRPDDAEAKAFVEDWEQKKREKAEQRKLELQKEKPEILEQKAEPAAPVETPQTSPSLPQNITTGQSKEAIRAAPQRPDGYALWNEVCSKFREKFNRKLPKLKDWALPNDFEIDWGNDTPPNPRVRIRQGGNIPDGKVIGKSLGINDVPAAGKSKTTAVYTGKIAEVKSNGKNRISMAIEQENGKRIWAWLTDNENNRELFDERSKGKWVEYTVGWFAWNGENRPRAIIKAEYEPIQLDFHQITRAIANCKENGMSDSEGYVLEDDVIQELKMKKVTLPENFSLAEYVANNGLFETTENPSFKIRQKFVSNYIDSGERYKGYVVKNDVEHLGIRINATAPKMPRDETPHIKGVFYLYAYYGNIYPQYEQNQKYQGVNWSENAIVEYKIIHNKDAVNGLSAVITNIIEP